MPPNPPYLLICSDFLALAAVGPRQCERLEPPVVSSEILAMCYFNSIEKKEEIEKI